MSGETSKYLKNRIINSATLRKANEQEFRRTPDRYHMRCTVTPPLAKCIKKWVRTTFVGINTLDSHHEWLALKTKHYSNRRILQFFSLQELCLCCVISGCWNSLATVRQVWFSRYCQGTQLQTPLGCSIHHQSWRAYPHWGGNSRCNLVVLCTGSLHCTANQVLSARHLPAQVCLGQLLLLWVVVNSAGPTVTGLGITWVVVVTSGQS